MKKIYIILQLILIIAVASMLGMGMNKLRPEPISLSYTAAMQDESVGLTDISDTELQNLADLEGVAFVDARDDFEFSMGHIPKAINIPTTADGEELDNLVAALSGNSTIIVYCDGVICGKSRVVGQKLLDHGLKNVRVYPGGVEGWLNIGNDLEAQ